MGANDQHQGPPCRPHDTRSTPATRPPSGTAIPTYHRSDPSHNAARHSYPQPKLHRASCSQTTAAAPHPRPPPRHKVKTALSETRRQANNLAALVDTR